MAFSTASMVRPFVPVTLLCKTRSSVLTKRQPSIVDQAHNALADHRLLCSLLDGSVRTYTESGPFFLESHWLLIILPTASEQEEDGQVDLR